jgi:hypothetical protein
MAYEHMGGIYMGGMDDFTRLSTKYREISMGK